MAGATKSVARARRRRPRPERCGRAARGALKMTPPRVIGHRGAAAAAPENTLAGLRRAKALGASWVELDVRLTRDQCPVLMHDARIDRTTDGVGLLAELAFAELRALDAGAWFGEEFRGEPVPSLAEVVVELGRLNLGAIFELKPAPGQSAATARAVVAVLARHWPPHLPPPMLSSFDGAALAVAHRAAPGLDRALAVGAVPKDWHEQVVTLGCAALHADASALDAATVAAVAARLPLFAYTVNEPEPARDLVAWGAAAIFTDRPDLIISAIEHT